jgi:hypothetical protein
MKDAGPAQITSRAIPLNELTGMILFSVTRSLRFDKNSSRESRASCAFLALLSLKYKKANKDTAPMSMPRPLRISGTWDALDGFVSAPISCDVAMSVPREALAIKAM